MNIGGLYCYPRGTKDLWDSIEQGSKVITDCRVERGEPFVILEESCFSNNPQRAHIKVLTTQGIIGWIAYIDKPDLVEVKEP
jgi:hypothetical protein